MGTHVQVDDIRGHQAVSVLLIEPSSQPQASALMMAKEQCILGSAWSLAHWVDGWILKGGLEEQRELGFSLT